MTGLDTGFFVKLLKGDRQAITLFEQVDEDADLCVSCLTIFELKRLSLRGALEKAAVNKHIDNIMSLCRISWLDNVEIYDIAAGLAHGLGILAAGSLILAGFILNGSVTILYHRCSLGKVRQKGCPGHLELNRPWIPAFAGMTTFWLTKYFHASGCTPRAWGG
jgi:predicted nucleic acid-binding protein